MTDWSEKARALTNYLRPTTFPLAVAMIKRAEDFPEKTRRPKKDMGFKTNICVAMTLSRKYGWTVGLTAEDNVCPVASYAYGWSDDEEKSEKHLTDFMKTMNYAADEGAAHRILESRKGFKLAKGQYGGVVFSPLERTRIEPDLVMIFGNPAQIMRLVHGATRQEGVSLVSEFSGRAGTCIDGVLQTIKTNEPKVVLPGNGDRVWAMVADDELAFTIPGGKVDEVIGALEATHRSGIRYPIPVDVRHEPLFPGG